MRQTERAGLESETGSSPTAMQVLEEILPEQEHTGQHESTDADVHRVHALRATMFNKHNSRSSAHSEQVNQGHVQRLYGLFRRIVDLLERQKYYRNPDLSLRMLADEFKTNTKYISESVNRHAGCNFMTFVNSYRIREVCQALHEVNADERMFEISMSSGFSSVATFYRVFKKFQGITPGRYYERAVSKVK